MVRLRFGTESAGSNETLVLVLGQNLRP